MELSIQPRDLWSYLPYLGTQECPLPGQPSGSITLPPSRTYGTDQEEPLGVLSNSERQTLTVWLVDSPHRPGLEFTTDDSLSLSVTPGWGLALCPFLTLYTKVSKPRESPLTSPAPPQPLGL